MLCPIAPFRITGKLVDQIIIDEWYHSRVVVENKEGKI
jgi:hypothetical protein